MAPFLKMFKAPKCTSAPRFMLLEKSEHHFQITLGLLKIIMLVLRVSSNVNIL